MTKCYRLFARVLLVIFSLSMLSSTALATPKAGLIPIQSIKHRPGISTELAQSATLSNDNLRLLVDNYGLFTLTTSDNRYLLYPNAQTAYLSVKVDQQVYRNTPYALADSYILPVSEPLTIDDPLNGHIVYRTPENIKVTLQYKLETQTVAFTVEINNQGTTNHDVDVRFLFDTEVDANDGSPLYAPGVNVAVYETDIVNPSFSLWRGYDQWPNPTLTSEGTITSRPYRVILGHWPRLVNYAWDYTVDPSQAFYTPGYTTSPTSDSAVLLYYDGGTFAPGRSVDIVTYYGAGAPDVVSSREKLINKYAELRDVLKQSIQSDLFAFADIQAQYLVAARLEAKDVLLSIWDFGSLLLPDATILAKFGKGKELIEALGRIALATETVSNVAQFMRDLIEGIPSSATVDQARDNYILPGLLNRVVLYDGERIGIKSYLEQVDQVFNETVKAIPAQLPADQTSVMQTLDLQIDALNSSMQRETWVPAYENTMCTVVTFGVLQDQRHVMAQAAEAYENASDWSDRFDVIEITVWAGAGAVKIASVIGLIPSLGSSSATLVSSETVLWGGAASIALVPELLGNSASGVAISRKVGMAQLLEKSLIQFGNDLKARETFFHQASRFVLQSATTSTPLLAQGTTLNNVSASNLVAPDLVVVGSEAFGQGNASLTVRNDSPTQVSVLAYGNLQTQLSGAMQTIGLVSAPPVRLQPGSENTIHIPLKALRSSTTSGSGYYLQIRLALSSSTGEVRIAGPYVDHFLVGTDAQLAQLGQQSFRTIVSRDLEQGEVFSTVVTIPQNVRRSRFTLFSSVGSDYDLHIYDGLGRHIGSNYDTGAFESQIPYASSSGAGDDIEWVDLGNASSGAFHVRVVSLVDHGDFTLTRLDSPLIPAVLDIAGPVHWSIDRNSAGDNPVSDVFTVQLSESGGFEAVSNLNLSITSLASTQGATIPASDIVCSTPARLPPGQFTGVTCRYSLPASLPDGTYRGSIQANGVSAGGGAVSAQSEAILTVATTSESSELRSRLYIPLLIR